MYIQSLRKLPGIMTLGEKVRKLREEKGLIQAEFAKALNVFQKGIVFSREQIAQWEGDLNYPSMDRLIVLADYFKTTIDQLVRPDVKLPTAKRKAAKKKKVGS
jgi:transcriptional regulator with XRE-family HTH domain